jgi:hypothetical protein
MNENTLAIAGMICAFIIIIFIYFVPTFIASSRKLQDFNWVFFLNLFLGWTGILWLGLLIWAALGKTKED